MQRNSLENACLKWISEVKTTARACPCILVGTKLDLRQEIERSGDEKKMRECVTDQEIEQAAKKYAF
jgi:GTPase SAR1 family protein